MSNSENNKQSFNFYKHFSEVLDSARKTSRKKKYKCLIPECECDAIQHSHIIQQHPALESVCDSSNKVIQPCIDEIHPMGGLGELTKFRTLGITEAMSYPLFCKKHDDEVFADIEKNIIDIDNPRHLLLLAIRGVAATMYIDEQLLYQQKYIFTQSEVLSGEDRDKVIKGYLHNLQRYKSLMQLMYEDIVNRDYSQYEFKTIKLPNYGLAICDTIRDEEDWEEHIMDDSYTEAMKVLFVNMQRIGPNTYFILGYRKQQTSVTIESLFNKWCKNIEKNFQKTIYTVLLHCNFNWCISPNCDKKVIQYLKTNYDSDRLDVISR